MPAIQALTSLRIGERVCFFTGENGSGKSTLLEAIAASYGFSRQGGSRNFAFQEERERNDVNPLADALQLGFSVKTGNGFFLRGELLQLGHADGRAWRGTRRQPSRGACAGQSRLSRHVSWRKLLRIGGNADARKRPLSAG